MNTEMTLAVMGFAAVSSITPGPNNMMLLASGVNHGFRATVPHMLGISIGFAILMLAAGFGLGALLTQWPQLHLGLKVVGIGYMVWLAWRLWHAEAPAQPGQSSATGSAASAASAGPLGFWGAAAFQWVNPKAWMMAVGAVAGFIAPHSGAGAVLVLSLICASVNLPCISVWALGGAKLSRHLAEPKRRRVFNAVMAILLLASIWPMLKT
ncbi:LysE family translocator [Roseateles sp. PN1]|uniref:LysE family translocator n=1 Tax=Roseateles sp. PN1 TaxID=3137372 RepID=UPI003138B3A6